MKMFKTAILNDREIKADKNLEEKLHKSDSLPLKLSIRAFFRIAVPYWKSRDSFVAWGLLVLIIALTSGAEFLATAINSWYKSFWDTIQNYDIPGFKHYLWVFVALASIHVVVSVYNSYLRSCLTIRWRKWLTDRVMHEWLENNAYYRMQLADRNTENPDQRISEDLNAFVTYSISLLLGTASDLAMLGTFGVVLWHLSHSVTLTLFNDETLTLPDGFLLYLAVIYAVAGTALTFFFGKPLVRLNFRQQEENHIMENIIYNELLVRDFNVDVGIVEYRTKNAEGKQEKVNLEVDFVCNKGSQRFYIQSAFSIPDREKMQQEQNSLVRINDSFKKIIVVKDDIKPWYNEEGILVLGLQQFLLQPESMLL